MVFVKTENGTKIPMKVNLLAVDDLKRHGGVWEDIDRTIDQCILTAYGHHSKMFLNVGEYGPHPKYMAHPQSRTASRSLQPCLQRSGS